MLFSTFITPIEVNSRGTLIQHFKFVMLSQLLTVSVTFFTLLGKIPREFFPFNICAINLHCSFFKPKPNLSFILFQKTSSLDLDPLCNVRKVTETVKSWESMTNLKC
jgi:hypothetical protein